MPSILQAILNLFSYNNKIFWFMADDKTEAKKIL